MNKELRVVVKHPTTIRKRYDVTEEKLASMLADEGYYDDSLNTKQEPIEVSGGFEAIKCYPKENVAVSIWARGDGIAEIEVYRYKGFEHNHQKIDKVEDKKKYIDDIEYVWVVSCQLQ